MDTLKNIRINPTCIDKELSLRMICRVIKDNLNYNSDFYELGTKLGFTNSVDHQSDRKQIKKAVKLIRNYLPYYSVTKIPTVDGSLVNEIVKPLCLAPTSKKGIFKVCLENDIRNLLNNIFHSVNKGVILRINNYVQVDLNGKIIEIVNNLGSLNNKRSVCDSLIDFKTSEQLFLKNIQLSDYPIYSVLEKGNSNTSFHEELAYLFTIGQYGENIVVIYESSLRSRASYLFVIDKHCYKEAINQVRLFFSSSIINKRSSPYMSSLYFTKDKGFTQFKRIIHDHGTNWRSTIDNFRKGFL